MASITIRNLDEGLKAKLRVRAAQHGRSMEEEARDVLRIVLAYEEGKPSTLMSAIRKRFAKAGSVDLPQPERDSMRTPPDLKR